MQFHKYDVVIVGAVPVSGQTKTDFLKAAERHYTDAAFLQAAGRVPTADHLAGVAAECGLKAIALSYLGDAPTS